MSFGEYVLEGMRASGWVIGFIAALALFLTAVGILILGAKCLAEALGDPDDEKEEDKR